MDQSNQILKANENLKKVFSGILKDLQEITKGFHKLHDIQKKQMSDNIKQSVILKQERYKEKIVQKQTAIKNKKLLKYQKDKSSKHHEHGHGFLRVLGAILTFSKVLLVTLIGFGLVKLIGKTEMGKLLINLVKAIAKAFVSVVKDLSSVLIAAIKESTKYLIQAVKAIFSAIGDFFGFVAGALTGSNGYKKLNVAGLMKMFLEEVVVKAFRLVGDVLKLAVKILVKTFQENTESIKAGFVSFMTSLFDTVKTITLTIIKTLYSNEGKSNLTGIYDGLKKIVLNIWDFVIKLLKTEFVNSKGETSTFGSVIGKYLLVWAGLKAGALALTGTVLQLSGAMGAFFEEMDASMARANAMKCCCNNIADNIIDAAEEIEKPKGRQSGGYREKIGKNSRLPTRKPDYGKTASGYGKVNMTVDNVPVDLPDSRRPGKIRKPGLGSVIGAGCSMACDIAERVVDASKRGVAKVGEVLSKGKDKLVQAGKSAIDWISDGAKKIWGSVSEFGNKLAQKVGNLGKNAISYVTGKFNKYSKYVIAMVKDNKIMQKVIQLATKRLGPAVERLLVKLAAAAAGVFTTGGIMTAVMGVLAVYDLAVLAYGLYELFFVEPPEGGGLYKEIEQMVDEWWKTQTAPGKEAAAAVPPCAPLAPPTSKPVTTVQTAPVAPKPPAPPASTFTGMGGTSSKSVAQPAPASAPAPVPTTPAVTPAPVAPTQPLATASATAPSSPSTPSSASGQSLDELKKQVIGGKLNNGGPRSKTVAAIIHHTGGRGLEATLQVLQNRGLSYHYLIDRDGRIVQSLPDNLVAWHAHPNDKKPGVTNANTVGIATVAKDDNDLTPEQISSAVTLEDALARKYGFPKTDVFGHGEVSSHKHPQEGATIVKAIRGGAMPSKELNIENAKIPTMSGGGYSQDSQLINQNMEQKNLEMKELRNTLLDMFSDLYQADSSGGTVINNTTLVNQSKSNIPDKLFEDPNLGEKIFKHAFSY